MVKLAYSLQSSILCQRPVDANQHVILFQTGRLIKITRLSGQSGAQTDQERWKAPMDISRHIWETKYRYADRQNAEHSVGETWRRVARALAADEPADRPAWEDRFFDILRDFKFLPGGRIQAGAGTRHDVTLFNCFVMGPVEDSIPGIFRALE